MQTSSTRHALAVPRDRSRHAVGPRRLALLVAAASFVLGAAPASAHARFTGSDPAEGTQLQQLPETVVLSYSEDIEPQFVQTAVVAPDGTTLPAAATVDGSDVTVELPAAVTAETDQGGTWQVVARVVSVDGHPVEHAAAFTLAAPTPAPAAQQEMTGAAEGDAPSLAPAAAAAAPSVEPGEEPAPAVTPAP